MSSSSSVDQNGQPAGSRWSSIAQYTVPPAAAFTAIIPVFYGFVAKSAQQMGKLLPRMSFREILIGGFKAAPTIGTIVGTQMIVQNAAEKVLMNKSSTQEMQQPASFASILGSSIIVGIMSAPALAVFNGQTMGRTVSQSLKMLSMKQAGAIVTRETSFLFSLRISDPASKAMKHTLGDNKGVEYGSAFVSGAIGSIIGHPADTALTLWQNGMKVQRLSQLMRGSPMKALAVGGFVVSYKFVNEKLNSKFAGFEK